MQIGLYIFSCFLISVLAAPHTQIHSIRVVRSPKHHHGFFGGGYGPSYGGGYQKPPVHYPVQTNHNGGSFAGSAAVAGTGGGGHGGGGNSQSLAQSQSSTFGFGPFIASFSQSQASSQAGISNGLFGFR